MTRPHVESASCLDGGSGTAKPRLLKLGLGGEKARFTDTHHDISQP